MKEQLAKELLSIIQLTKDGVVKGLELAGEQAPDLIRQILMYGFARSFTVFLLVVIIVLSIAMVVNKIAHTVIVIVPERSYGHTERKEEKKAISEISGGGIYLLNIIPVFIFAVFITESNFAWLKIWLAPKLYLIEYLSNFIK